MPRFRVKRPGLPLGVVLQDLAGPFTGLQGLIVAAQAAQGVDLADLGAGLPHRLPISLVDGGGLVIELHPPLELAQPDGPGIGLGQQTQRAVKRIPIQFGLIEE